MAKRIIEETLANGEKRYSVQSNTILGIPTKWWHTITITVYDDIPTEATFSSLEKARDFLGLNSKVVSSRVIV